MKKIAQVAIIALGLFFVVSAFTSCSSDQVHVKAANGAIMTVKNGWDLPIEKGQKVCIKSVGIVPDWYIPNTGEMKDTMYLIYNADSTRTTFVEYKIVTVIK